MTERPAPSALAIVTASTSGALALAATLESAKGYARASKADETRRAYAREWSAFVTWCLESGGPSLPTSPEVLACYVAAMADKGRKPAGIDLALAAISAAHAAAGHDGKALRGSAPVRAVRAGVRRTIGTAQRQAAPATVDVLRRMLAELPGEGMAAARDRALLLLGFSAALRRSELVALALESVSFTARGAEVTITRSKTDQEGRGRVVAIPLGSSPESCPVRALRAWIQLSGLESGPIFRSVNRWGHVGAPLSGRDVARTIKRYAARAGLEVADFSGHSLRAGLATSAALAGRSDRSIMAQTGHRSRAMVDRYVRGAERWRDNAAAGLL